MSDQPDALTPHVFEGEIVDGEVAGRVRVLTLRNVFTMERSETWTAEGQRLEARILEGLILLRLEWRAHQRRRLPAGARPARRHRDGANGQRGGSAGHHTTKTSISTKATSPTTKTRSW
jgi:hypothetical protein